jgi:sulfur relay (sulfurtransferase) DsrF/TusC family protein
VGNAILAEEERATLLLVEDGVYFAVREQNPSPLGLPNNLRYVEDFLELGGRIVAVESALKKRGLTPQDLVEGVEVAAYPRLVRELESHAVSVTF